MSHPVILRGDAAAIPEVQALAGRVWREHYPGIISPEQIEYMLERGYSTAALRRFVEDPAAGLLLAREAGVLVGFAAWYGDRAAASVKLDKLYVATCRQRAGIGARLIGVVAEAARTFGARTLSLNVNKHNHSAQRAYRNCGFVLREAVVVDIGGGFVMDDYVMELPLAPA